GAVPRGPAGAGLETLEVLSPHSATLCVQDKRQLIERLQQVIRQLHQCESIHLESVPVQESFRGKVVWEGEVEVFTTSDHPKVNRIYAWQFIDKEKKERFAAIPALRTIPSAAVAVKVFLMTESDRLARE
ncbi:MAG TPA: hypothetical protein VMZ27_14945, partial [Candidatus Saccharimonadales bacterium]|nr:hypothetical protein [Candidatus Saccharimonadales bacterium]